MKSFQNFLLLRKDKCFLHSCVCMSLKLEFREVESNLYRIGSMVNDVWIFTKSISKSN